MDEFFRSLQEIAAFRDFCTACVDERLRDRLVEEARRRLLETANLTLQTAADICRAAENAANSRSAIGGSTSSLQKMSEYRRRSRGQQLTAAHTSRTDSRDRCSRRGSSDGRTCPATGRICFKSGKNDHFSSMCRSRGRSQARRRVSAIRLRKSKSMPASKSKSLPDIHV